MSLYHRVLHHIRSPPNILRQPPALEEAPAKQDIRSTFFANSNKAPSRRPPVRSNKSEKMPVDTQSTKRARTQQALPEVLRGKAEEVSQSKRRSAHECDLGSDAVDLDQKAYRTKQAGQENEASKMTHRVEKTNRQADSSKVKSERTGKIKKMSKKKKPDRTKPRKKAAKSKTLKKPPSKVQRKRSKRPRKKSKAKTKARQIEAKFEQSREPGWFSSVVHDRVSEPGLVRSKKGRKRHTESKLKITKKNRSQFRSMQINPSPVNTGDILSESVVCRNLSDLQNWLAEGKLATKSKAIDRKKSIRKGNRQPSTGNKKRKSHTKSNYQNFIESLKKVEGREHKAAQSKSTGKVTARQPSQQGSAQIEGISRAPQEQTQETSRKGSPAVICKKRQLRTDSESKYDEQFPTSRGRYLGENEPLLAAQTVRSDQGCRKAWGSLVYFSKFVLEQPPTSSTSNAQPRNDFAETTLTTGSGISEQSPTQCTGGQHALAGSGNFLDHSAANMRFTELPRVKQKSSVLPNYYSSKTGSRSNRLEAVLSPYKSTKQGKARLRFREKFVSQSKLPERG